MFRLFVLIVLHLSHFLVVNLLILNEDVQFLIMLDLFEIFDQLFQIYIDLHVHDKYDLRKDIHICERGKRS